MNGVVEGLFDQVECVDQDVYVDEFVCFELGELCGLQVDWFVGIQCCQGVVYYGCCRIYVQYDVFVVEMVNLKIIGKLVNDFEYGSFVLV